MRQNQLVTGRLNPKNMVAVDKMKELKQDKESKTRVLNMHSDYLSVPTHPEMVALPKGEGKMHRFFLERVK